VVTVTVDCELQKIIPDSVTKEVTSEDVFAESDKTRSHDLQSDEVDTKPGMDLSVVLLNITETPRCNHLSVHVCKLNL